MRRFLKEVKFWILSAPEMVRSFIDGIWLGVAEAALEEELRRRGRWPFPPQERR
jgi:hypothetical protein